MWRNWPQILQIMCRDTWKVIQSLQLLVSHQMRLNLVSGPSVGKTVPVSQLLGYWGQLRETGPEHPKSCEETHEKESKFFRSLFHVKWGLTLVSRLSVGWVIPVSWVLGYLGNLGRLGPNTPNHAQRHQKQSKVFSSSISISSDEILLLCQGDLGDSVIPALWVLED